MVDPVMDEQLAMFVVESHCRSHPSNVQAAAKTGGASQETREDNTQIINDKVGKLLLPLLLLLLPSQAKSLLMLGSDAVSFVGVSCDVGLGDVTQNNYCFRPPSINDCCCLCRR